MPKKSVTNWDKIHEMLPEDNLSPNERLKGSAVPLQPDAPKADDTYTPKYSGNSYTPSYTGSDFNGWYKYHYGSDYDGSSSFTRASGMSDLDWEQGNNLYNYYNSEKFQNKQYEQSKSDAENRYGYQYDNAQRNRDFTTSEAERRANSSLGALERYYLLSGENLDKSKTQSQQQASVMYDKLKKYLPVQVKAQGLGGLGVSESTLLDAYNKYSSAMGSIESDYQQNRTSLDNNYQDNKRSIESDRDSAINAANNAYDNTVANIGLEKEQTLSDLQRNYDQFLYDSQEKARSSNQGILDKYQNAYKDKQQRDFSNAYNTISASTETDETKMLSYIEQFKDKLDPEDYATLQQYAKQVVQANKTKRTDVDRENAYIVAQGTVEELIGDDNYEKAKEYLDANKEIFGDQVYNAYIKDINSKLGKNDGGESQNNFKIEKLSNGNEIKALSGVNTRYNVQPADSENLEFQLESGGNIYGVKLGDKVASAEQADVKKYMYSTYNRKPQAGDLCYYNGQIVVVCQNGNLRYLKDAPNFLGTWNWWGVKHLDELINSVNVDYD